MKARIIEATIKWLDTGEIQEGVLFKVGDAGKDDDDIFFYLDSESEMEDFRREGVHEWIVLESEPERMSINDGNEN